MSIFRIKKCYYLRRQFHLSYVASFVYRKMLNFSFFTLFIPFLQIYFSVNKAVYERDFATIQTKLSD